MPDPIQVERLFQEVNGFFESTQSIRHRHNMFREFVELLDGAFKKYETYIVQLLDELPLYSGHLTWSGIDPKEIEIDLSQLEKIELNIKLSEKSANFYELKRNLQQVCLLLFCCVNHREKVSHYLQKITGLSFDESANKEMLQGENQTIDKLYELLSREIQAGKIQPQEQKESIQELYHQLLILQKSEGWSVFVPVAEKYEKDYLETSSYGRLRKMTVDLYGIAESDSTDELIWASNIYGAEVHALKQTSEIIKASRSLYERASSSRVNKNYYRGGIRFENTAAIHDGNSANLGIAALWYTHLLKASGQRERYFMNKNLAITGDIDENESVQPVNEKSIGLKAKAVFFSWAKTFVIPDSQRELFEDEIRKLQKRYPGRSLATIGVTHLREIFYDRRVASHDVQGRIPYFINRLKNEYSRVVLITVIAFLLLAVARLAYGPVDRNAVDIEYEGSHLILKNETGSVLDRIEVGETTVNYQNTGNRAAQYPLAALADLDEDGTNELIFINRVEQANLEISTLKAWSVTGDSLIWEHQLTFNYHYHRQSAFVNLGLRASELQLMNTNDGLKVVLNAGLIQYFQSVAFTIDAISGEIEQEYVHPGRLNDVMVYDIDDDEIDELIFTGINNAFWNAIVGVLEYGEAHGYGPATRDYTPAGLNPANEEVYLLIPKSVIGKYFNPVWKYNMGERVHYDLLSQNFYFTVVEGTKRFTEFEDEIQVIFYFNRDLKPVGIGTNDLYDITARDLYRRGEISIEPDFGYFESLQDSILYWNGEEFLKTREFFHSNQLQQGSR